MPGIRLFDVRAALAALAALGLAGLAALAIAVVTHLPVPAPSTPATQAAHASSAGLSRLQSLPLQAQSVISSTLGTDTRAFAARRTASGWGLRGGGVRADFRSGEPTMTAAGGSLSLSLAGAPAPTSITAHGNRVTLTRPGLREWYAAGPLGIEQGFTLASRAAGIANGHQLTLALAVTGSLHAQAAGSNVNFLGSRNDIAARYGGLTAVDASGRHLPAALSVAHGRVLITVNDRGARYPITIDPLVQQGPKLTAGDPGVGGASMFGFSVAVSADGNEALIGGPSDSTQTVSDLGAAWVFARSGSTWTQQAPKLVPRDPGVNSSSAFGGSVALSADGTTAIIGGIDDNSFDGAAWVFTRSGSTWTQQGAKLTAGSGSWFGNSVALSADGNTALIGGPADSGGVGAAWVYMRSGTTWSQQTELPVSGETGSGQFGESVALSSDGNTALVGANQDAVPAGAAFVFTRSGTTWMQQGTKLVPGPTDDLNAGFGGAVALSSDGNTALIGGENDNNSTGAAWIYIRSSVGTWSEQKKLVGSGLSGGAPNFGSSVALSGDGNTALIGANSDAGGLGSAFMFTRSGATWTQQGSKLTGSGEVRNGFFGHGVALSSDGQTALVGGDEDADEVGAVWVFAPTDPVCSSVSATTAIGGGPVGVTLSCAFPGGAHPNFSIVGGPSHGALSGLNAGTGQLTYTSQGGFAGQDSFTYHVNDQWGLSNTATAVVNVPGLPTPTCSNVTAKGKAGATKVTITLKCTGPVGHPFSYGIVSRPGNGKLGKINQSNGKVTYTTHVGAQGNDRFVYNATNAGGSSKPATATIKLPQLKRITTGMNWDFHPTTASFTQINSLSILALPGGAKATLSCAGKGKSGCPISKHTVSVPKHRVCKGKGKKRKCTLQEPKTAFVNLSRFVAGKHLRLGTKMSVTMFEPGWIGKRFTFTIVKNHQPPDTITAMAPGSSTRLCPQC